MLNFKQVDVLLHVHDFLKMHTVHCKRQNTMTKFIIL